MFPGHYGGDGRDVREVYKVPPLTAEQLKEVKPGDVTLMQVLWKVCRDLSHHPNMTIDEPPPEILISAYPEKWSYNFWVLLPPGKTDFGSLAELHALVTAGMGHDNRMGLGDVVPGVETKTVPPRLVLNMTVLMADAPFKRTRSTRLIIEQELEYRPIGRITMKPDGVSVRRVVDQGTLFSDMPSPRSTKRRRIDPTVEAAAGQ